MTTVYQGPKGGFYIMMGNKKRYVKKEEVGVISGQIKSPNKPLSPAKKSSGTIREQLKGWTQNKPAHGAARSHLAQKCGSGCFLIPDEFKYPVCPSCGGETLECCRPDCRGIRAARNRSRMVVGKMTKAGKSAKKHQDVLNKAEKLMKKYGC